ncbi:MAG: phosphoglycolate phosphatase [Chitinophagales bacterium]|nr:phosphoglycolate phosphatase [Hyphomicrobiales bacterium]
MRGVTVVFDLDGTMVDTAPDLMAALDHLLVKLGLPPSDPEVVLPEVGHGARAMIDRAIHALGHKVDPADLDPMVEDFIAYYRDNIAVKSRPFPGFEIEIAWLAREGARLAVCTNKREDLARKLLTELKLDGYFHAVLGGDTLAMRKPHPGHLLATIEAANGNATNAVMVGDSAADIDAARAASVPSIAVDFGYSGEPVSALKPDAIIHHFRELRAAVHTVLSKH